MSQHGVNAVDLPWHKSTRLVRSTDIKSLINADGPKGYTGYANHISNLVRILTKGF